MKTKSKFYLKKLSLLAAILAFTLNAYAGNGNDKNKPPKENNGIGNYDGPLTGPDAHGHNQGNDKPVGNTGPKKDKDKGGDTIPLDGGLSILLAGAAIFGIKKLREKK